MADLDQDDRTEEPTQQRREDFRKRGQVAQTRELASAMALITVVLAMWVLGKFCLSQLFEVFDRSFGDFLLSAVKDGDWREAVIFSMEKGALVIGPFLALFFLMALASSLMQVGFLYNEEAMQFRWERIDPISGLGRIISLRSVVDGIRAIVKLILVGTLAYFVMSARIEEFPGLSNMSPQQLMMFVGNLSFRLIFSVGVFMLVVAGADFFYQRWDLEKQMRMTKQEIKEEHKSREGDPLIKARIRRIQRDVANRRMMAKVPTADVVVTNPTHIAVALKYDDSMVAPQVIAKGADHMAEKIKSLARQHGVPLVENKPLARAMFKMLKIGQSVPRELYTAVAEVLSYVYRLKGKV